ncbi:HEAT repeat domain-containing protein [Myxococcus landrumensis]|uniref:HEAT repeat domain-containing protein n=1 Tax=Myxococcus landrumensis TaxID=2813577 RepID=A0ABX7NF36_9BACT|nr:HEAT repeat domain-containing protein [Myxococcus landrumus]QSQ17447.1 HEAT repeat domain-containing protein [Myxococcus landrumus]
MSLTKGWGALPVEAEVAWLIAEVLREPTRLTSFPRGERLLRAIQRLSPADASDAGALVDALCSHRDPEIQLEGLRHLGNALESGLVTLTRALELSIRVFGATDERVALRAAELLAEPWAARPEHFASHRLPPLPPGRAERIVLASLRVLARRGDAAALRLVLEDSRQSNAVRREALALLAPFAGPSELALALHLSREDPLFFGPTCAGVLQTLYRRGVRCEPDDVPGVCELFLSSPAVAPTVIAEVLSLRQREYVDSLETLSPSSLDFSRHLSLLRELEGPEAFSLLRALLVRPEAHPVRPDIIEALGHQGHEAAEEDLLGCFDAEPWACLDALRRLGSERTTGFLRTHPGMATAAWRGEALALLAVLEDTPSLDGGGLDQEVLASLQPVFDDAAFVEVSRLALQTQHPLRLQAIGQLGRESRRRTLRPLGQLLLDIDEQVRSAAQQAIVQVGRGLHASGRMRLLGMPARESAEEAGARLLTECLLEQLQQRDLSDAQLERVLGQLVGRTHSWLARRLRRFLRHGSVQVQKLALECLAHSGDARAVAWLVPFARSEDIYRLRQALSGLGVFKVEWAVPFLAQGLAHPNMNIKKTAAEALAMAGPGSPAPIGVMLDWLRRHDNPGLRESLVRALRATCARGYVATLLDALQGAGTPRERELLCEALSGVLSPQALVALLRQGAPCATVLSEAVFGGVIELSPQAHAELVALLRRHGLSDRIPATSEAPQQARLLRERRLDEDLAWMDDVLSSRDAGVLEAAAEDLTRLLSALGGSGLTDARAAVLLRHLDRLLPLLASTHSASRRLALGLLRALSGRLSETERVGALAEVRRAWAEGRLEPHEALTALYTQGAVPSLEEARMASALPEEPVALWGAERLVLAEEWSSPRLLEALTQARSLAVQRFFVPYALREVPPLQVLAIAVREPNVDLLTAVRKAWDARVPEDALLDALVLAVDSGASAHVGPLVRWMADIGTEAARAALRRLARHTNRGIALAALAVLEAPASGEDEALFVDLLSHDPIEVRRQAARQLWRVRGLPRLQSLLDTLGEARPLRWVPPGAMDRRELEALRARLGTVEHGVEGDVWLESLLELLEGLGPKPSLLPTQVLLLLDVWRLGRGRAEKRAAALLRSYPATRVLPFILPMLREGHTAVLQVLPGDTAWGPELMALFLRARGLDRTHFLEWLQRGASAQGRDGRTLEDALLEIVDEDEGHRELASRVLGGLASWGNRDDAFRLGDRLIVLANSKDDAWAMAALANGLERQGPEVRVALLSRVTSPTLRTEVVDRLAPLLLDDSSLERSLTAEMMRDVERKLETLAWEAPEPEPAAMKWMVLRRKPRVVERLTGLLTHRKSSVRMQAHRLLKNLVPRETYLELTCALLADTEAGHVVRAIRMLAFGGHLLAVSQIATLLHDRRNPVARAARDALLVMGDAALPILRGELAHARPDRREPLAQVISSLTPTMRDGAP